MEEETQARSVQAARAFHFRRNIGVPYFYHAAPHQKMEYYEIVSSIPSEDGCSPPTITVGFFRLIFQIRIVPAASRYQKQRHRDAM
jgi:hypothetical protein